MKNVCLALLLTLFGLASQTANADLYRWVDKNGNVSYQDRPPPADAAQVEEKNFNGETPPADDDAATEAASKFPVTLYSVPECGPCDDARNYLKKRQIPFKEVSVATDVKAQEAMRKAVGNLSVPTITIGSKVMQGYIESLLAGELDDAGYPKMSKSQEGATSPGGSTSDNSSPESQ